jgi:hypothetical protein
MGVQNIYVNLKKITLQLRKVGRTFQSLVPVSDHTLHGLSVHLPGPLLVSGGDLLWFKAVSEFCKVELTLNCWFSDNLIS